MSTDVQSCPDNTVISGPEKILQTTETPGSHSQPVIVPNRSSGVTLQRHVLGTDADWILYVATAIFISEVILAWPR